MMAKADVNGANAQPCYKFLRDQALNGEDIKWNFAKFLCDGNGQNCKHYEPRTTPDEIKPDIEKYL